MQTARMRRTSSWRSICFHPGINGRCSKILWKFPNRDVQTFGYVNHNTNGLNHGPEWKTQSFLLRGICTVILWPVVMGNAIWENPIELRLGEGFQWRMLIRTPWKRIILISLVDDINWLERNRISMRCGKLIGRFNILLGCGQRQCEISKNVVDNYKTKFESRISAGAKKHVRKINEFFVVLHVKKWVERHCELANRTTQQKKSNSLWSYDMEEHVKKWVERHCELANKTTQQLHVSTPCIDVHHFKEEELKFVKELTKVFSQIVLKSLFLASFGRTDIRWSVNKFCTIDHKMDQGLWQTIISFDLLHSSYMRVPTVLSCGKHCKTMQIETVSRLRFCRRFWGPEIYTKKNIVRFWKSYICSNRMDV